MSSELTAQVDLVKKLQRGDEVAWIEFLDSEQSIVWNWILKFGISENDIPDVRQEVFVAAVHSIKSFRGSASLRTWLLGIAHLKAVDQLRKRSRAKEISGSLAASIHKLDHEGSESEIHLPSGIPDGFEALVVKERLKERHDLVQGALAVLAEYNPVACQVLTLFFFEELSYKEIASALNLPLGTVQSKLNRAKVSFAIILNAVYSWNKAQPFND